MPTFGEIVARVARRPGRVLAAVVALAVVAAALAALTLRPTAGTDTLIGRGSDTYQATQRYHEKFGDDAVIVLVRGKVTQLVLTSDVERVLGLEGCLSGNLPKGVIPRGGRNGPCARIAATKPVQVVYGPGTFINESVRQISDEFSAQAQAKAQEAQQAGDAALKLATARGMSKAKAQKVAKDARSLVYAQFVRDALRLGLRYGLTGPPQLNDKQFVNQLVFDSSKPAGTPKARFAYLFPTPTAALVQVRLKPTLSDDQRRQAIALLRQAVAMPDWRLSHGTYAVTGAPVVVDDLTTSISHSLLVLLIGAVLVMAGVLAVVFRQRLRLLPLLVALMAAALTFGALALVGAPLTMATIGVLPVLLGLAVDYAIQFQSRVREEGGDVRRAAALGLPTIATAGAATAAGFLVVALSPVPMVREFGLLLVVGIGLSLACAVTAGTAVLVLAGRRRPSQRRAARSLRAAARGADELVADNPLARALASRGAKARRGSLAAAVRDPRRALLIGAVLAVAGWGLGTQTGVETDLQKLVPGSLPALRDLTTLQKLTGVGGEVDVTVAGADLTDPRVVSWMSSYQKRLLDQYGYSARRGCGQATLCPAFSLPDLFRAQGSTPTREQIRALLDAVPPYFSQGVITRDRRVATMAFGIRLMPLDRQEAVLQEMRAQLRPPPGVRAELAGLPVLAADANAKVSSAWRRTATLIASLLAVALVLLAAFREPRRALVPLVPIALATGWSSLILFGLRIPLNPMSVTLGALVVAISTEFSVLLSERFRAERAAGHDAPEALARTYRSTGAAVLASGVTAIAGFAVLALSDIRMLRSFGWVTVVDLTVSLLGVLLVLPSVLVLAERGSLALPPLRLRRLRARRAPAA